MSSMTLFIIIVAIIALLFLLINFILAPHNPYQEKYSIFECGFHSFLGQNRTQFAIRFFTFALMFLILDLEILLTYPFVVSAYINNLYGLIITLIFISIITIGFIYELGKGALKVESKQDSKDPETLPCDGVFQEIFGVLYVSTTSFGNVSLDDITTMLTENKSNLQLVQNNYNKPCSTLTELYNLYGINPTNMTPVGAANKLTQILLDNNLELLKAKAELYLKIYPTSLGAHELNACTVAAAQEKVVQASAILAHVDALPYNPFRN